MRPPPPDGVPIEKTEQRFAVCNFARFEREYDLEGSIFPLSHESTCACDILQQGMQYRPCKGLSNGDDRHVRWGKVPCEAAPNDATR